MVFKVKVMGREDYVYNICDKLERFISLDIKSNLICIIKGTRVPINKFNCSGSVYMIKEQYPFQSGRKYWEQHFCLSLTSITNCMICKLAAQQLVNYIITILCSAQYGQQNYHAAFVLYIYSVKHSIDRPVSHSSFCR